MHPYCSGVPHRAAPRTARVSRSLNCTWSNPIVASSVPITTARCSGFQHGPAPVATLCWMTPRAIRVAPRSSATITPPAGLVGLEISGNFLFDPATPADMREGLHQAGASAGEVGDLWLRGDRGAQGVMTEALAAWLDGCLGQVRSVEVRFEARPLAELRFPPERAPRALQTVEASLRVDAVASAGFGLSRTRLAEWIRQGVLRVDWRPVTLPSHLVKPGQRIQLEGRGELEITEVVPTQRGRWRISMTRR